VAILIVLSGGAMHVSRMRQVLGYSLSLLSSHLRVLREASIVDYEEEGTRHTYSLLAAARIDLVSAGLKIHLSGNDGSTLVGTVPKASPVMRLLVNAVRAVADRRKGDGRAGVELDVKPIRPPAPSTSRPRRRTA
jgi:DNA-binding transcriptional ArsR family regulator